MLIPAFHVTFRFVCAVGVYLEQQQLALEGLNFDKEIEQVRKGS